MFLREAAYQEKQGRKNLVLVGPVSQNSTDRGLCLVVGLCASGPSLSATQVSDSAACTDDLAGLGRWFSSTLLSNGSWRG